MAESLRERLCAQQKTAVLTYLRRPFSRNEYETKMCFRGNEPESDKVPEQSARLRTYLDLCECTSSPNLSGFSLLPARLRLSARTVKAIWATGPLVMRHDPDALKCELKDTHTCTHVCTHPRETQALPSLRES